MAGANPLGIIQGILDVEEKIGSFIKGDVGGDSAIVNHFRDQYRARCEELSNAPEWLQGFIGLGAGGAISRVCKPYLDDNQWDLPELEPPFTGGQCAGKVYQVNWSGVGPSGTFAGQFCSGSTSRSGGGRFFGPITLLSAPDRTCAENPDGTPAARDYGWQHFGNRGAQSSPSASPQVNYTSRLFQPPVFTVVWDDDGPEEDCGDPEPVPVPGPNPAPMPDPVRLPGDEPRPNPRNPDGLPDIPVDPFPDPIGGPGFPALPDGFGFGGGKSGGGGAGRSFDPIENNDETGGQDEDFDDPPEGEVWVGAYLELTQVPGNITTVPGTGPENGAYFRIVGNFSIYSDSESSRLYSDSVQVRNRWTKFIGNPQGLPVTGARVRVLPGVRYRVIPVSAPADPDRNGEE